MKDYQKFFVTIFLGKNNEDFFSTYINALNFDEIVKFYDGYYYTYLDESKSPMAHFISVEDDKGNVKTHTYCYEGEVVL